MCCDILPKEKKSRYALAECSDGNGRGCKLVSRELVSVEQQLDWIGHMDTQEINRFTLQETL